jgi:hypothetical protein
MYNLFIFKFSTDKQANVNISSHCNASLYYQSEETNEFYANICVIHRIPFSFSY